MSEEQTDQYLIHSDVFPEENQAKSQEYVKDSISFLIPLEQKREELNVDDDGDLDVYRPERFNLTLGTILTHFHRLFSAINDINS